MNQHTHRFFWVGNHPGLDLVNTEAVDAGGGRLELVSNWADLIDWADTAGLIDAELAQQCRTVRDRRSRDVLTWFRQLRIGLRSVLESRGRTAAATQALDASVATVAVRLSYQPGHGQDAPPITAAGPLEQLRLAVARTALDAAGLDRSRVRRCENPRCVLLYYDTTKNRSRRWCDMAVCGNRAKAGAHYRRIRHPRPQPGRPPLAHRDGHRTGTRDVGH